MKRFIAYTLLLGALASPAAAGRRMPARDRAVQAPLHSSTDVEIPLSDAPLAEALLTDIGLAGATGFTEQSRIALGHGEYSLITDNWHLLTARATTPSDAEAAWLRAMALYARGDSRCAEALAEMASQFPTSPLAISAELARADYLFFSGSYPEALEAYSAIPAAALPAPDARTMLYRMSLTRLRCGLYEEARRGFDSLTGVAQYAKAATFYQAYTFYALGDYRQALSLFSKAEEMPGDGFSFLTGYFMMQIDFSRGEWEKVLAHGKSLLARTPVSAYEAETRRIMGESALHLSRPETAIALLDDYLRLTPDTPAPSAIYALGTACYQTGDIARARTLMEQVAETPGAIGQGAWLCIGQCDVSSGDYRQAILAFDRAARLSYDPRVAETAAFNAIAARTRGASIPFGQKVTLLEDFISRFPDGSHASEIRSSLAAAYFDSGDFEAALRQYDAITPLTQAQKASRQLTLLHLGASMVASDRPSEALQPLREACKGPDSATSLQALLWEAEALYSLSDYHAAANALRKYIAGAEASADRSLAIYNLAYSLYNEADYTAAATQFRKAAAATPSLPAATLADARLRLADCLYYTRRPAEALPLYTSIAAAAGPQADYAALRRAIMLGLTGQTSAKLAALRRFPADFPSSPLKASAALELGEALQLAGLGTEARQAYADATAAGGNSPEARRARLALAMLAMKESDTDAASEAYRSIISTWPTSEEARIANDDLRRLEARRGNLAQYATWLESIPGAPRLSTSQIEQLAFDEAAAACADNPADVALLEKYVRDYPDGEFLAPAMLGIAQARLDAGQYQQALAAAEAVAERRPDSPEAPHALLMKARLIEEHFGAGGHALDTWRLLADTGGTHFATEARAGIMRCTDSPAERLSAAETLLASEPDGSATHRQALLFKGIALAGLGRSAEAKQTLRHVAGEPATDEGARANVELGDILLKEKRAQEALKLLTAFTESGTTRSYWLARGYILLADALKATGRDAEARQYLRALDENYPGDEPDIRSMLRSRLKP